MATIVKREKKDYGGEEVWTAEDIHCPIYAAPHVRVTEQWLDEVLAQRKAGADESKVDAMYDEWAEQAAAKVAAKREAEKDRLGTLYAKKTRAEVESDVKTISDPWTASLGEVNK